jgi:hypothetical protein
MSRFTIQKERFFASSGEQLHQARMTPLSGNGFPSSPTPISLFPECFFSQEKKMRDPE